MRFVDEVEIDLQAGRGGDGCQSFLRERGKPKGGADGGNGGGGGDIVLEAVGGKHTLLDLHFQRRYRAQNGRHGQGNNRHGRSGKDLVIRVPVGTLAKDPESGGILKDLKRAGDRYLAASGGGGGRGNASFMSSTKQAPDAYRKGQPGETRRLRCELKLLADVGIVGLPNAGKSTLIAGVSAAHPKIADYPFTTLVPHLGLVRVDEDRSFVIADIPGIVPGASSGAGLGFRFLRHVERSSVLLFLVDLSSTEETDPMATYRMLRNELGSFSPQLLAKARVLVFNKIDLPIARERMKDIACDDDVAVFFISGINKEGLGALIHHLARTVCEVNPTLSEKGDFR